MLEFIIFLLSYMPEWKRIGTPAGKRPLGRRRRRWEDNIRRDLKEMSINTRNWVDSDQERVIGEQL